MSLQDILVKFKPYSGEVLGLAIAKAIQEKPVVLDEIDTTAGSLEKQADAAINAALAKDGGLVKMFAGEIEGALEPLLANEVTAGETDLSALYDKGVALLEAEQKTLS